MASITGWKCRWPNITAPSMMSSESSLASNSTISTASCVPATTRSSWLSAISSICGLSTYSLLMKPTRAAPIGPMNGAPESVSAADAATIARMSGSFSRSCDSTVTMTCVSQRQPSANSGRIGRSISRETSVSFSVGRAFALEIAAGNAAGGVVFFLVVDRSAAGSRCLPSAAWPRRRSRSRWCRRTRRIPRRRPGAPVCRSLA